MPGTDSLSRFELFPEEFDPVETARSEAVEQIGVDIGEYSLISDGRE